MKIITFGRHSGNEVVINDAKVSRNHLQIIQDDSGNFTLVDLNSTNGTYVNGRKVTGEVSLNPDDTVRAGDTSIVWLEYFLQQPATSPVDAQPLQNAQNSKPKSRRKTRIIAAAAIVVLLLIGGGSTVYFTGKAKKSRIEAEVKQAEQKAEAEAKAQAEQKQRELKEAQNKADRLRNEAEEATRKALISKSKKDEGAAREARAEAEKAQTDADKKAKELADANAKIKDLEKKTEKLAEEKEKLKTEKKKLQQTLDKKEAEAKAALEKERQAKEEAQKKAEFYEQFSKLNRNGFESVCKELKYGVPDGKDAKTVVKEKFDSADNAEKQKIIDAVKKVLDAAKKAEPGKKQKKTADTATNKTKP